MKNKLLLFLVVLCFLPSLSLAQTSTENTKKETIKDKIEAKKEALNNSVEQIKQTALDKIKTATNKFIQTVVERFDAAINRLGKLADRIESRITKMETGGIDVTEARGLLTTARGKIDVARASTVAISPDIESVATSAATSTKTLREDFKIIKTQIAKAKEDIKIAHAALVEVVNSLKPGDNKPKNQETNN